MRHYVMVFFIMFAPLSLHAQSVEDERAQELFSMLRCVVCDGQSLAESDAAIAIDMRRFIVLQIDAGKTDEQILETLIDGYGETILMAPPVEGEHTIVWLLPVILLIGGGLFLFRTVTSKRD